MSDSPELSWSAIESAARALGLIPLGAIDLEALEDSPAWASAMDAWRRVASRDTAETHGSNAWMSRHAEARPYPTRLVKGATTVISFAWPIPASRLDANVPYVARFARGDDYHQIIPSLLRQLGETLRPLTPWTVWRTFADTPPLWERVVAAATNTGFIGRNSCFIHHELGSFVLLGEIFTDARVPDAPPARLTPSLPGDGCGDCRACVRACPTAAIAPDGGMDASRCLSYWSIEHRGPIPDAFRDALRGTLFGCDRCQDICPRNAAYIKAFGSSTTFPVPDRVTLRSLDQETYDRYFGHTTMTRAGREGLRRNASLDDGIRLISNQKD